MSATQVTQRHTAQQFLARAVTSLLEIDQFVLNAWPAIEAEAAAGNPVMLPGFPISLQLDPAALSERPEGVSDAVAASTASLIYDDGLDVLSDSPRAFRLVSRGAAFDGTVGRLSGDGHGLATVSLIVSGTLAILLALATSAQVRGLTRFGAPAISIGLGAMLVWIAAILAQSALEGRAESSLDPFAADLWLIAVDAISLLARNAAIVGLASGVVAALALAGAGLLRGAEGPTGARSARYR
ncbi:MAG: hypothetical protein OXS30_08540 [Chloroflexota bacterium]|nr:hypothetical protein [Chloroflexota bacterium]